MLNAKGQSEDGKKGFVRKPSSRRTLLWPGWPLSGFDPPSLAPWPDEQGGVLH
jgi:hypothetical protein